MTDVYRTPTEVRQAVGQWRKRGLKVALVPTMGALHEGHLTLVRQAFNLADKVVVSVFVNPTQFGPNEDFARYPRQEAADLAALEALGCDGLYAPTVEAMYPPGHQTAVMVGPLAERLEGLCRPGHFQGVATVVSKLLLQALPDMALFGEKDWQQLMVIAQVVRDLDIPVAICGVEIVREDDGLALSSRNRYLSAAERAVAPALYRALCAVADGLARGDAVETLVATAKQTVLQAGFRAVDYISVCDPMTLTPWTAGPARVLAAVHLGTTRLIDNIPAEGVA